MPQRAFRRGDTVRIRGERWRVAAETKYARVSIVEVDGCDRTNATARARFILPFDVPRLAGAAAARVPRVVSLERWRRSARIVLADAVPHWSALRSAARTRLAILSFQLEPSLAMTRGDACRFLIADAVGLGKTIQAGLMIAETMARIPDARALVVTPAGLREQWRDELAARFDIAAAMIDAATLARDGAQHGPDVNPWAIHAAAITSIDYVKRPDVARSLESLTWDIVVFDEAHALAGRSDRAAAAAAIAERARVVVLLTATPHSGDDDSFARLCELGHLDDACPLRTFRRTRAQVGLPHRRRSIRLAVRPTPAELQMHRALDAYARQLITSHAGSERAAALVTSILHRRACSSAFSLARSLERRLALIASTPTDTREQPTLPFMDPESDEEPGSELGGAWLANDVEERRWLARLVGFARAAEARESKPAMLRRLLRRINEPVIVFTEYRDTLHRLHAALIDFDPIDLHGGLTGTERREALHRFSDTGARLLLATDAASEGLNLHHRCRLVVNLEIPWTPLRLEQRVGRVDRLGQMRRVHAICLVASSTREGSMTVRLDARTDRIAAALEHPAASHPSLAADSLAEARRLTTARMLSGTRMNRIADGPPPVAIVNANSSQRSSLWVFRLPYTTVDGEPVFETVAGVRDSRSSAAVSAAVAGAAATHHALALPVLLASMQPWLALAGRRERAMASALRKRHARLSAGLLQPGLFDHRSDRAASAQAALAESAIETSTSRLAWLDRIGRLQTDVPSVAFGVAFR